MGIYHSNKGIRHTESIKLYHKVHNKRVMYLFERETPLLLFPEYQPGKTEVFHSGSRRLFKSIWIKHCVCKVRKSPGCQPDDKLLRTAIDFPNVRKNHRTHPQFKVPLGGFRGDYNHTAVLLHSVFLKRGVKGKLFPLFFHQKTLAGKPCAVNDYLINRLIIDGAGLFC